MSMRGEDVLAFALSGDGKKLTVIKAEVKSRSSMAKGVLDEARSALSANEGRPSPHALSFIADRLSEKGEKPLKDAIDDAQLKVGLAPAQITHMLFAFSGNELSELLEKNLKAYVGPISQQYVGLQVKEHQDFIKKVFKAVAL